MRPWYAKKSWWLVGLVALAVAVAVAVAVAARGGGGGRADRSPGAAEIFQVGQTATTSKFDVTLNGVQDPFVPTNEFEAATEGQRFVAVELTMLNTSDEEQVISTLVNFEVFDQEGRDYDIARAGVDLPGLDATLQPGEQRRGFAVFEVPAGATDLSLRVKGSPTAAGSVFAIS